jgi:hypothetical protein
MVTTTYSFRTEDQDMITEFEDFCTWVFVVVDDIWEQIAPFFKRPGPAPVCSDSEMKNDLHRFFDSPLYTSGN